MQISPHGSVLLKVTGNFSWAKGAIYQAEWPGNLRAGAAKYVVCRECDGGYAVSLPRDSGSLRNDGSSLDFTLIVCFRLGSLLGHHLGNSLSFSG